MLKSIRNWCVIYTRPQQEKKVNSRLSELGITTFLPLRRSLRVWKDRKKILLMPIFPSYIFVYIGSLTNYFDIVNIDGVLNFVRIGGEIANVRESVVEDLKLICNESEDFEIYGCSFEPGKKMVINHGVMTGLACEMIRINGQEKALVRVDLLQRSVILSLPAEHLLPA